MFGVTRHTVLASFSSSVYALHSIFHAHRHTETIKLLPDVEVDAQHVQNTETGQERETDRQRQRKKGREKQRKREREDKRERMRQRVLSEIICGIARCSLLLILHV